MFMHELNLAIPIVYNFRFPFSDRVTLKDIYFILYFFFYRSSALRHQWAIKQKSYTSPLLLLLQYAVLLLYNDTPAMQCYSRECTYFQTAADSPLKK